MKISITHFIMNYSELVPANQRFKIQQIENSLKFNFNLGTFIFSRNS